MDQNSNRNSPSLLRLLITAFKLQWDLTGWRSLVSPTTEIANNLLNIGQSYLFAQIINLIAKYIGGKTDSFFQEFWLLVVIVMIINLIEPILSAITDYNNEVASNLSRINFETKIAQKLSRLEAENFEDDKFLDRLSRVDNVYTAFLTRDLSNIISGLATIVVAAVAIFSLNWLLFVLAIIAALPRLYSNLVTSKRQRETSIKLTPLRRMRWFFKNALSEWETIKEIRPYGATDSFLSKMKSIQRNLLTQERKDYKKFSIINGLTELLGALLYVAIRVWLFLKIIATKGIFSIGDYTFYNNLIAQLEASSVSVVNAVQSMHENLLAIDDYFYIMNLKELQSGGKKISSSEAPSIEFVNVSFKYPDRSKYILRNVNFKLNAKEKMALIGVNGAGKSTMVKLLLRFYKPTEGKILVNGMDLNDIDLDSWYKALAVVQQDINKYPINVEENISLAPGKKIDRDKLKKAIAGAKAEFVYDLPQKEKTFLTRYMDGSVDISGGQWQKIALARLFYRQSPLLILDEPTSAIDARAETDIFHRLWNLQRNKGAIVISHRFSTVREADLIVVLDHGKIIEQGTHAELMQNGKIYHELFTKQAKSYR